MHPRLIDISVGVAGFQHIVLPSYFTMVALGFIVAAIMIRRWAGRHGIDQRVMFDFVIWMAIWGIVGSRILHVFADGHFWDYVNVCRDPSLVDWRIDPRECKAIPGTWDAVKGVCHPINKNCLAWADITAGGFAFYGGFIAAGLFSVYFIRRHRLPAGKILDMSGWALVLGLAWGRMGCMLAGCCFGMRTDSALSVVFPMRSPASRYHWEQGWIDSYRLESLPVHYAQAYSAFAALVIAAYAYFLLRPRKRFDGQVFCVSIGLYAIFRFFIEFIRRDERGGLLGLTTSQIVAVLFLGVIAWLWIFLKRRATMLTGTDDRKG
jgi:phosphatidylglycerol---prolipoprotein diacylglyceryl transferase